MGVDAGSIPSSLTGPTDVDHPQCDLRQREEGGGAEVAGGGAMSASKHRREHSLTPGVGRWVDCEDAAMDAIQPPGSHPMVDRPLAEADGAELEIENQAAAFDGKGGDPAVPVLADG